MKKLSQVKIGQKLKIVKIETNNDYYIKLIEMGFLPNIEISVENICLFKDPITINISGNIICLRIEEADSIYVKEI